MFRTNYEKVAKELMDDLDFKAELRDVIKNEVVKIIAEDVKPQIVGVKELDVRSLTVGVIKTDYFMGTSRQRLVQVPLIEEIAKELKQEIKEDFKAAKKAEILKELLEKDLVKELDDIARQEVRKKIDGIIQHRSSNADVIEQPLIGY